MHTLNEVDHEVRTRHSSHINYEKTLLHIINQLYGAESFCRTRVSTFIAHDVSEQWSQQQGTGSCHEPDKSSSHPHTQFSSACYSSIYAYGKFSSGLLFQVLQRKRSMNLSFEKMWFDSCQG